MTHQPDISDDAVLKATGRAWREWLNLLAGADMAQRTHEEIAAFLRDEHGVPSWWQQAIANEYEESIGRRSKHETDDGFQVSVSRTIDLSVETVFQAWADPDQRAKWLRRADFEPTKALSPGTVRGKWVPDGSWVDVDISDIGDGRCELKVALRKLASEAAVERARVFWKQSVDRLVERVGSAR